MSHKGSWVTEKKEEKKQSQSKAEPDSGRRNFIKYAGAGVAGFAVATVIEYPILNNQVQTANNELQTSNAQLQAANQQVSTLTTQLQQETTQAQNLQSQLDQMEAFITLNAAEQSLVESIVETIIPSDQSSPGAKEAGVIYFIDRQLATDYGKSGNMYQKGPFIMSGQSGPITVDGITYTGGTPTVPLAAGQRYQYSINLKEFWRYGLDALQKYANSAYGTDYEKLTDAQKTQLLTDLYNNKPTDFNDILPQDFFFELVFMTWSGFTMDPMYGGNRGMIGWKHTGFNGLNMGSDYGEGYQVTQLMVSNKPIRLQPSSLGQYQKRLSGGA